MPGQASAAGMPFDLKGRSLLLMEANTGRILYEREADRRAYPASTTKIVTLIAALEQGSMEKTVIEVSSRAESMEGSALGVKQGDRLTLETALYGLMMVSGNDVAEAIAENLGGGSEGFAALMNKVAEKCGAVQTHFANPSGLPDERHYTTARDLASITAYGLRIPAFRRIVGTEQKWLSWAGEPTPREIHNENKLLWQYDGANGVKTGYTVSAGRCVVASAERNGVQLIAVVLDSEIMWTDAIHMLDYGFSQMQGQKILQRDQVLQTVPVAMGREACIGLTAQEDIYVPLAKGEGLQKYRIQVETPASVTAPVARTRNVGKAKIFYEDHLVREVDLVAVDPVERRSFFGLLYSSLQQIVQQMKVALRVGRPDQVA